MTTPAPRMPTQIKHYRFVRELGRGGMGAVFEAIDIRDDTRVAVKLLHPWLAAEDSSFRDRFEREAHIAALLRSPYAVRLLDFGVADSTYYLVMEFVEGETVAAELKHGQIEIARVLRIGIDVARALEEASARGVVHRDIKPDNILVTPDGRVKVTDFGIARQEGGTGLTVAGGFVGTADYAAPEQARGDADHRTDVYSLGATLYCMLSGKPPFSGGSVWDVLNRHQTAQFPMGPLSHLPDVITNPVRRCMEKDPRDRYQSATELAGALERAVAAYREMPASARTVPSGPPPAPTAHPQQTGPGTFDPTRVAPPSYGGGPAPSYGGTAPPARGGTALPPTTVQPSRAATTPGTVTRATVSMTASPLGLAVGDTTRYELAITNAGTIAAHFALVAREPTGALTITLPPAVTLAAGETQRLAMEVRQRHTPRGGGTRAQFQVAASRDDGSRAGFVNVMMPLTGAKTGGPGKVLLIGGAMAVVAAAAVGAFLVLGGDDKKPTDPGATATTDTSGTPGTSATASAGSIKVLDRWDFAFRITSNSCSFGAPVGDRYPISFRFKPVSGSGDTIKDGDRVNVTGVQASDVAIGAFTFRVKNFEIVYPVKATGGQTGTATVNATFSDPITIGEATLEEKYTNPNCVIAARAAP